MMFLDETKALLGSFENVYATLEASFMFVMFDVPGMQTMLREFLTFGGPEKVIYASSATVSHPHYLLQEFQEFRMPEGFRIPLNDDVRALVMGGNLARLHGIDVEERRKTLESDRFSREVEKSGYRTPWSSIRQHQGHQGSGDLEEAEGVPAAGVLGGAL